MDALQSASDLMTVLETNVCIDHRIKPHVELVGNSITIVCCCPYFHNECLTLAKELADVLGLTDFLIE